MIKNTFWMLLIFVLVSCKSNADKEPDASAVTEQSQVSEITQAAYEKALSESQKVTPVDRICKESKGYTSNEWEGTNECSWAVEKYRIAQFESRVKRQNDQLFLQLQDSSLQLVHSVATEGAEVYYQFKAYLKNINTYCVAVYASQKCPEYWLIDAVGGQRQKVGGLPVFNSSGDAFMLGGATKGNGTCGEQVEYWELEDKGQFSVKWTHASTADVQNLVYVNNNTWYGLQKTKEGQLRHLKFTPKAVK